MQKSLVSGIYKIVNKLNGKYYVGSSNDIIGVHGRWNEHKNGLRSNRHDNQHLQRAWNKYGSNAFEFIIVKLVPIPDLLREEQLFLDIAKAEKHNTYNMAFLSNGGGGFTGHKHTEESKRKTSLKMKGIPKRHRGIPRPCVTRENNPRWRNVSDEEKQSIKTLYLTFGYTMAQKKTKETMGIGSKVFFRVYKEFTNICLSNES